MGGGRVAGKWLEDSWCCWEVVGRWLGDGWQVVGRLSYCWEIVWWLFNRRLFGRSLEVIVLLGSGCEAAADLSAGR